MNPHGICIKSRVRFSCVFDVLDRDRCFIYLFLSSEHPVTEPITLCHNGVFLLPPECRAALVNGF